jgi:hypothetical protein
MAKISELADGGAVLADDEVLVLRAGGNVRATMGSGITSSPGGDVDVNGKKFSNFESTGIDDNATSTAITIDSSERVGIKYTGSNLDPLRVGLADGEGLSIGTRDQDGTYYLGMKQTLSQWNNAGYLKWEQSGNTNDLTINAGGGDLKFITSNQPYTERMVINSTGNVGIGTATPVNTNNYGGLTLNGSSGGALSFTDDDVLVGNLLSSGGDMYFGTGGDTVFRNGGYTGSDETMRIDSTGSVGIGSTNPKAPLTVTGTPSYDRLVANFGDGLIAASGYQRGVINVNGRVDGTDGRADISFVARTTTNSNWLTGRMGMEQDGALTFNTGGVATTDATERVRIGAAGNVGINDDNPDEKLVVNTGSTGISKFQTAYSFQQRNAAIEIAPTAPNAGNGSGYIAQGLAGGGVGLYQGGTYYGGGNYKLYGNATSISSVQLEQGSIRFQTADGYAEGATPGNNERMRIDSSGNVGIGTDNPISAKLEINDTSPNLAVVGSTRALMYLTDVAGNTPFFLRYSAGSNLGEIAAPAGELRFLTGAGSTGAERMRIDDSGNVHVGKSAQDFTVDGVSLSVAGSAMTSAGTPLLLNRDGNGAILNFYINDSYSGFITQSSGSVPAFGQASDERLKDNIVDHESELANVMSLRPTRWDWKDEAKGSGEGFIAQELEATAWSDLVTEGDDGFKQVSGLGAVETRLIKAMQEQQVMIETLQAEVAALKGA